MDNKSQFRQEDGIGIEDRLVDTYLVFYKLKANIIDRLTAAVKVPDCSYFYTKGFTGHG